MFAISPLSIRTAIKHPLRFCRIRQARLEYTAQALSSAVLSLDEHWASVQEMLAAAVENVQQLDQLAVFDELPRRRAHLASRGARSA
jgi:hypothetical protein